MSRALDLTESYIRGLNYRPLHAGDTWPIGCTATENSVAIPITKAWFTIKRKESDPDSAALLALSSAAGEGITLTDALSGLFTINVAPAHTAALAGTWHYDIQVLSTSGDIITLAKGRIEILPQITQATS